jgi:peptidoglycan/xylan/chitin deacetylase (PgdA/CDA1 family)
MAARMNRFFSGIASAISLVLLLGGCEKSPPPIPTPTSTPRPTPQKPRPIRNNQPVAQKATVVYAVRTKEKVFALTFDDGPHPTHTPQVLAALKKRGVKATFFMVGSMVRAYPKMAQTVYKAGHPVANHSWSHPFKSKSPKAEVEHTGAIIKKVVGVRSTLFRPPYGLLHNGLADSALKRGESVVIWSSYGADWDKNATSRTIAAKVLRHASPGGIALLHDGGGHRSETVAAVPIIIDTLKKHGYRFVTVPQLLKMGEPITQPPPHIRRPAGDR